MKMQFSLKALVTLLVFASLLTGFLTITIRHQNELRELKGEFGELRDTTKRIETWQSAVVKLRAERQEVIERSHESSPSVKRIDAKIQQLENEMLEMWHKLENGKRI